MKTILIAFLLFSLASLLGDEPVYSVVYSDIFHKHYPRRGREFDLVRYELEAPVVIWDELSQRKVTVLRTRGDKYPYEDQKTLITVEGRGLETSRVLSATDFRTVEVLWITGKLIFVRLGLGNIAAVEAVYDVEKDLWAYRESVQYIQNVDHARQRTAAGRRGCNRRASWPPSLSLGRSKSLQFSGAQL